MSVSPNCGICRWLWNNNTPCQLLSAPPKDCHWFQIKKSKRSAVAIEEYENTAADDYLDYLHGQW